MNQKHFKLVPVSAAVFAAFGSLYVAAADTPTILPLGETITVTGVADGAPSSCDTSSAPAITCSNLRSAVAYANGNANETTAYDKIVLANGSMHVLDRADTGGTEAIDASDNAFGDLDITTPMNIETADNAGAKATIQGGVDFNDRLLHINSTVALTNLILTKGQGVYMNGGAIYAGDAGNTTISSSVITDNFASWDGDEGDLDIDENTLNKGTTETQGSGGGIYSKGILNISMSTLSKNTAQTFDTDTSVKVGNGGAIYASQATTIVDSTVGGEGVGNVAINGGGIQMAGGNALTVERSTFSHNEAVSGGGMNVVSPSAQPFTIVNSTISANHVTDSGAGINTNASVTIQNTTIANNAKDSSTKGSGLNQFSGVATLHNTLFANNTAIASDDSIISANCGKAGTAVSSISSSGGNLSTDASCALTDPTDQQSVADAKIGPLALNDNTLNGNLTHALLAGSPAIDKGTASNCPATDGRGTSRPLGAACDVGAYEAVPVPVTSSGGGGGCAVGSGKSPFDPVLPALAALGLVGLGLRRMRR